MEKDVRTSVSSYFKLQRQTRLSCDPAFSEFLHIFDKTEPSSLWKIPKNCYEISLCKFICKLCASIQECNDIHACLLCQKPFTNAFIHAACACPVTASIRDQWWYNVVNFLNIYLTAELCALTDEDLFHILLGRQTLTELCSHDYAYFRMLNYRLVYNTATLYNRAISSINT